METNQQDNSWANAKCYRGKKQGGAMVTFSGWGGREVRRGGKGWHPKGKKVPFVPAAGGESSGQWQEVQKWALWVCDFQISAASWCLLARRQQ